MKWIKAGNREALKEKGVTMLEGKDRQIALFFDRGNFYAVDNRCPHMGFPLNQGSVQNGILTCHWHHARFALDGGCAFDLFADDVPTFPVKEEEGTIFVGDEPDLKPDREYYLQRLQRGMDQNLTLLQAKSIIGLREQGESLQSILETLGNYGAANHETWRDGMTLLGLLANLDEALEERTLLYGLTLASSRIANNCDGQPRRRERGALAGSNEDSNTLTTWVDRFVQMRHRDGLERTLLTALEKSMDPAKFQSLFGGAILTRVYMDTGHLFDFLNKVFELAEYLPASERLLQEWTPLLVREAVEGRGEEDKGAWRNPVDLITLIRDFEDRLLDEGGKEDWETEAREVFEETILKGRPEEILERLTAHLRSGIDPVILAQSLAFCAGWRLSRFAPANDLGDWFSPAHAFTYSNALVAALERAPTRRIFPGLLHGAMAIYQDRFLNVPEAYFPHKSSVDREEGESDSENSTHEILELLDRRPQLNKLVRSVTGYIRKGEDFYSLVNALAWATLREDLDFHHLQVLEAAFRFGQRDPDNERMAVVFAGVARYLGSHCPTARSRRQPTDSALRLHRGTARQGS